MGEDYNIHINILFVTKMSTRAPKDSKKISSRGEFSVTLTLDIHEIKKKQRFRIFFYVPS